MSDTGLGHDSPESKKSVQICEDPNSKAHLEALFNVLQEQPKGQGFRDRKLPDSFFSPSKLQLGPSIIVGPSSGPAQHFRSMSMPASFPDAPPRQFSLDSAVQGAIPPTSIPPGWEMARTPEGVSYFIE